MPGNKGVGALQLADQIMAEFVFDGPAADAVLGKCAVAKSAESTGQIPGGFSQLLTPFARLYQMGKRASRDDGECAAFMWILQPS